MVMTVPYPLGPEDNYKEALKVACPFCHAKAGVRCVPGFIFPQYPHTPRVNASLMEQGWTQDEIDYQFVFDYPTRSIS